ncbi:MAG: FdtA/QdtA family cupin domain-containing protein [Lachnospiraceae bacterium]
MQIIKYQFQQHGDERGQLVALEEFNDIPFEIKRVYYMYDTKEGVRRGYHAHKSLQQILICIHGSCKILLDNGKEKKKVYLEKPYEGLYVPNNMWREMYDFSPDAVLMCLASEVYNEDDYIRDYQQFLDFINGDEKEW